MATSGSKNFSQNRDQVIYDALELLGVYGIGRTVSNEDLNLCQRALNRMIKSWGTVGLHLWCKSEAILHLNQYTSTYTISDLASSSHVADLSDEIITQLSSNVALGSGTISVLSTEGMEIGDNVGVVLSDNSLFWTTISSIPNSTSIQLTDVLSNSALNTALVFTHTSNIYKPLRILSARLVWGFDKGSTSTVNERVLGSMAYQTYFDLPTKTQNGLPTQFHYEPKTTNGTMYIWPRPLDCSYRIEFTYERIIDDLDTATDDFDFPSEWIDPLVWQLALRISPAFGKEDKALKLIAPAASDMLNELKNWDTEISGVNMAPDMGDR